MTWPWIITLMLGQLTLFFAGRGWERLRSRRERLRSRRAFEVALASAHITRAVIGGDREPESSELPPTDTWPAGFKPDAHVGAIRVVELKNGHGGVLVLKVRGGAFRIVSFTRPTKFDPLSGEADTTDLWMNVDELVKAVKIS